MQEVTGGVGRPGGHRCASVRRRDQRVATQRPGEVDAVARRCGQRDLRPQAGIADLGADMANAGDGDDAGAVGRLVDRDALVAGRGDDDDTGRAHRGDRVGIRSRAGRLRPQAEVDHPRRVRVARHVGHVEPGRPADAGGDVGRPTTAFAEHAHRQHAQVPAGAGDADGVVGRRGDQAGDLGAVPTAAEIATGQTATGEWSVHGFVLGLHDPVARVGRIVIAPTIVVGRRRVADEVVA